MRGTARVALALVWLLALPGVPGWAGSTEILEVGKFSAETPGDGPPSGWRPLTFEGIERHTRYRLVRLEGEVVVEAVSSASASALIREIRIDPKEFPIVEWRWRAQVLLKRGDPTREEGEDYPARLYITFEYDTARLGLFDKVKYEAVRLFHGSYPPYAVINYVWESHLPKDAIITSAHTERDRMIVVESGAERLGQWVTVRRNLYEDYRRAFGEEPPMISGVAIMTDTDETGEEATAYYGDIRFRRGSP